VLKDILFKGYELDQQVRFTPVSEEDYQQWVGNQGKKRHIVTLLTRKVTAGQLQRSARSPPVRPEHRPYRPSVGSHAAGHPADKGKGCIEFSVRGEAAIRRPCAPNSSAWPRS
jgi:phosphoserine phosphatase